MTEIKNDMVVLLGKKKDIDDNKTEQTKTREDSKNTDTKKTDTNSDIDSNSNSDIDIGSNSGDDLKHSEPSQDEEGSSIELSIDNSDESVSETSESSESENSSTDSFSSDIESSDNSSDKDINFNVSKLFDKKKSETSFNSENNEDKDRKNIKKGYIREIKIYNKMNGDKKIKIPTSRTPFDKVENIVFDLREEQDLSQWVHIVTMLVVSFGFIIEKICNTSEYLRGKVDGWYEVLRRPAFQKNILPLVTRTYYSNKKDIQKVTSPPVLIVIELLYSFVMHVSKSSMNSITRNTINRKEFDKMDFDDTIDDFENDQENEYDFILNN